MVNGKATAIYCRLANKDDSIIEVQKEKVLKYAAEQGYENVTLFIDNGESGNNFNRPSFKRMNTTIKAGKIDSVIVDSINRLGRNTMAVTYWIESMKRRGITVKSLDGLCENFHDLTFKLFSEINSLIEQ